MDRRPAASCLNHAVWKVILNGAPAMLTELVGNGPMSLRLAGRAGYTMQH